MYHTLDSRIRKARKEVVAMSIDEILLQMKLKAQSDPSLRERLLATKASPTPIADFCAIFRNEGLELYEMDLIEAGEADYAAMKRSTNGGGENSPALTGSDDYYEMFLAEI